LNVKRFINNVTAAKGIVTTAVATPNMLVVSVALTVFIKLDKGVTSAEVDIAATLQSICSNIHNIENPINQPVLNI
jgi:hypothetical protein